MVFPLTPWGLCVAIVAFVFKNVWLCCCSSYLFLFLHIHTESPKMPILGKDQRSNMLAVLTFIVPALLNFIAMKYEGRPESPFETHPIVAFFSISALLLYCSLSLPLVDHLPVFHTARGAGILRFLTIISFSLSIALPTWLLFPGLSFFLLHLPLLILLSTACLCGLVEKLIRLARQKILICVILFARRLPGGRVPPLLPRGVADTHFALEV